MNPDGVNVFTALRGMQGQLELLILGMLAVKELVHDRAVFGDPDGENAIDEYHVDNCLASLRDAATELRILRGEH